MASHSSTKRVLPGFHLTLGYAITYLCLIILIPLSAVFIKTFEMSFADFWNTVSDPRIVATYRVSFGISLLAASINAVFGLMLAYVRLHRNFRRYHILHKFFEPDWPHFRDIFRIGKKRGSKWHFNQSSLFIDFLAGNQSYQCTPWANPTYNVFGWQKPCYLLVDEGHVSTYKELMEKVTWPTWLQLQQSTMIVLGATLFITAIVWVMDFVAAGGLNQIYKILR